MNKKLLLGGGVLAVLLLMGGKKSKAAKPSIDEEILEGGEEDVYDEPEPAPKPQPKVDDKWKQLSQSRRDLADLYVNDTPLVTPPSNLWDKYPYGDYNKWKTPGNNNYLDWLTNQVYWDITVNKEKTTDIYTPIGEVNINYSSKHPFLLKPQVKAEVGFGEKGWVNLYEVDVNESTADAKKRLAEGIDLWLQIKSYIKKVLKPSDCPPGVVCK